MTQNFDFIQFKKIIKMEKKKKKKGRKSISLTPLLNP